jgi:hypothetical protein
MNNDNMYKVSYIVKVININNNLFNMNNKVDVNICIINNIKTFKICTSITANSINTNDHTTNLLLQMTKTLGRDY